MILSAIRNSCEEIEKPLKFKLSPELEFTLLAPIKPYRISIGDKGELNFSEGDSHDIRSNDLTETQLIEEDASIFQYKTEIGGPGTGKGYYRYLQERGRYTMAFKFLANMIGVDNAYIALPPLVRAAFMTTWPMTTFSNLVAFTVRVSKNIPTDLGINDYFKYLIDALEDSPSLKREFPDIDGSALFDSYSFLDGNAMNQMIQESKIHPLNQMTS